MNPVPVVFFAFNRPDETRRVLQQLKRQTLAVKTLIAFADGPRSDTELGKTEEVRRLLSSERDIPVRLICRPRNVGCARNITSGISEVMAEFPRAVIVEDDVFPSSTFYEAMCVLLDKYDGEKQIFSVGGYPSIKPDFPVGEGADVIFSARFSCWGWATWSDRWQHLAAHLLELPADSFRDLASSVLAGPDVPSFIQALREKPGEYWDIPLLLQCLRHRQCHALTRFYLTNNIGVCSGVHGTRTSGRASQAFLRRNNPLEERLPRVLPDRIQGQVEVSRALADYIQECGDATALDRRSTRPPSGAAAGNTRQGGFAYPARRRRQQRVEFLMHIKEVLPQWMTAPLSSCQRRRTPVPTAPKPDPKDYSTIVGKGSVVPCQIEAYFLALNRYVGEGATVLDVGFGLGYGLNILAIKARQVSGVDVDPKVLEYCSQTVRGRNPRLADLQLYDGTHLPFSDGQFDVVTCVDVLEHVEEYDRFLDELLRVTTKGVFISTPNRRPEYTNPDGSPKNYWHLREWSFEELDAILRRHGGVEWNVLNGPFDGPFAHSQAVAPETLTLSPFLFKN